MKNILEVCMDDMMVKFEHIEIPTSNLDVVYQKVLSYNDWTMWNACFTFDQRSFWCISKGSRGQPWQMQSHYRHVDPYNKIGNAMDEVNVDFPFNVH